MIGGIYCILVGSAEAIALHSSKKYGNTKKCKDEYDCLADKIA